MKKSLITLSIVSALSLSGCGGSDGGASSEPTETMVSGGSISEPVLVDSDSSMLVNGLDEQSYFKFQAEEGTTVSIQSAVGEVDDSDAKNCILAGGDTDFIEVRNSQGLKLTGSCNDLARFYVNESGEFIVNFDYPLANTGSAKILFTNDNEAPVISLDGPLDFKADESTTVKLTVTDPNGDEIKEVTLSGGATSFASLVGDFGSYELQVAPKAENAGLHDLTVTATDSLGMVTTANFKIRVVSTIPPTELEPSHPLPTTPCEDGSCLEDDGFNQNLEPMLYTFAETMGMDYQDVLAMTSSDRIRAGFEEGKATVWVTNGNGEEDRQYNLEDKIVTFTMVDETTNNLDDFGDFITVKATALDTILTDIFDKNFSYKVEKLSQHDYKLTTTHTITAPIASTVGSSGYNFEGFYKPTSGATGGDYLYGATKYLPNSEIDSYEILERVLSDLSVEIAKPTLEDFASVVGEPVDKLEMLFNEESNITWKFDNKMNPYIIYEDFFGNFYEFNLATKMVKTGVFGSYILNTELKEFNRLVHSVELGNGFNQWLKVEDFTTLDLTLSGNELDVLVEFPFDSLRVKAIMDRTYGNVDYQIVYRNLMTDEFEVESLSSTLFHSNETYIGYMKEILLKFTN